MSTNENNLPSHIDEILKILRRDNAHGITKLCAFITRINNKSLHVDALERKLVNIKEEFKKTSEQATSSIADSLERASVAERQVRNMDRELAAAKRQIAELKSRGDH